MKSKRPLRPSFMVVSAAVVSAAAATLACGSSSSGSSGSLDGGEITNPPGMPAGCPATPPTYEDPCSVAVSCTYDAGAITNACGTFPMTTTAQCTSGKWQTGGNGIASCNPPPVVPDSGLDASDASDASDDGG